jgi:drug/metabolite transporter (DMT)-like permease
VLWWPAVAPTTAAWTEMAMLAFACTGIAYLMYLRLIAHIGPADAIALTYLVPLCAMLWGGWFLAESVTATMLAGGAVILLGTALATGIVRRRAGGWVRPRPCSSSRIHQAPQK